MTGSQGDLTAHVCLPGHITRTHCRGCLAFMQHIHTIKAKNQLLNPRPPLFNEGRREEKGEVLGFARLQMHHTVPCEWKQGWPEAALGETKPERNHKISKGLIYYYFHSVSQKSSSDSQSF